MSIIEASRLVQFQSEARNLFGKAGGAGRLRSGDDLAIATTVDRVTIGQGSSEAITYSGGLHQDAVESPYELLRSRLVTLLQEQNAAVQIASGSSEIDISSLAPEEAQVLVAEDGYFGIEQTSERIFQFAVGLAGNDSSRLEEILRGIEDGFADAEQAWGGKLPEISYQTQEAIMNKIDHWLEGAATA